MELSMRFYEAISSIEKKSTFCYNAGMGSPLPPDLSFIDPEKDYDLYVQDSECSRDLPYEDDTRITFAWYRHTGQFVLDWYANGFDSVCGGPYPSPYYPHSRQIILQILEV